MTKQEYAEEFAKQIGGIVQIVDKPNGIQKMGVALQQLLSASSDLKIGPIMYIDDAYEHSVPIEKLVEKFNHVLKNPPPELTALQNVNLKDYAVIKDHLILRLYNDKTNAEIYKSAASYGFSDLIMVPYIDELIPNTAIRVTNGLFESWGISIDELFDTAEANCRNSSDYIIMPLSALLTELGAPPSDEAPLCVITNKKRQHGAYGIIALRDKIKQMFPDGVCVIPSSIHECLIAPKDLMDYAEATNMVNDVNDQMVKDTEVLGTHVYAYC